MRSNCSRFSFPLNESANVKHSRRSPKLSGQSLLELCMGERNDIEKVEEANKKLSITYAIKRGFSAEKSPRATKIKIIKNCEGVAECNGAEA